MWGPEGWWKGRRASSRGNSVGYRQILSQLVEVKWLPSIVKMLLTFWKVKHCKSGRFDGWRPKSNNKHKQQEEQWPQQTATGTQATRKAATSRRIRSNTNSTNSNPETVRAKRCGSRRWEGVFPWNFVRLCSSFFSACKQYLQFFVIDFFGCLMGERGRGANQL